MDQREKLETIVRGLTDEEITTVIMYLEELLKARGNKPWQPR